MSERALEIRDALMRVYVDFANTNGVEAVDLICAVDSLYHHANRKFTEHCVHARTRLADKIARAANSSPPTTQLVCESCEKPFVSEYPVSANAISICGQCGFRAFAMMRL